jgi:hypothetical protein
MFRSPIRLTGPSPCGRESIASPSARTLARQAEGSKGKIFSIRKFADPTAVVAEQLSQPQSLPMAVETFHRDPPSGGFSHR